MSGELVAVHPSGDTLKAAIRRKSDYKVWYPTGSVYETWGTGGRTITNYGISTSDIGGDLYQGDCPADLDIGLCLLQYFDTSGYCVQKVDNQYWDGTLMSTVAATTGDVAITVTIRTTSGTAIPGVHVWLNTSNDRTSTIVVPLYTDISGSAVFYLTNGYTYYLFCSHPSYSFIAASISPVSGTTSFTKDIATALASVGSITDYSSSFLSRALSEISLHIDEPSINKKYTDAQKITKLEQSYMLVLGEIRRNARTPIVARYTVTLDGTNTMYRLPPTIGQIQTIYKEDTNGLRLFYDSRSTINPFGRNVWVEGQTLHVQSAGYLETGAALIVEYIPDGTPSLHNGTCTLNVGGTIATFGETPNAGSLDTRLNAYAGCVFRIINVTGTGATGNYTQERTITSYDRTTRAATLDVALSPVPTAGTGGYIFYEIAPAIHKGLDMVLSLGAAYTLCLNENMQKRATGLLAGYRQLLRNVRLDSYYSVMSDAVRGRSDNYRVSRYYSGRFRTI